MRDVKKKYLAWESFARVWTKISHGAFPIYIYIFYVIAILYSNLFLAVTWLVPMTIQYCHGVQYISGLWNRSMGDFCSYTRKRLSGKPIFWQCNYYLIKFAIVSKALYPYSENFDVYKLIEKKCWPQRSWLLAKYRTSIYTGWPVIHGRVDTTNKAPLFFPNTFLTWPRQRITRLRE